MQQINVLHVIDHTGFGGAQTIVRELLNRWESNDIKLKSCALRKSNPNSEYSSMNVSFSSNHESKYSVHSFFDLKKIVKAEYIAVLHLHLPKSIVYGVLIKTFYCKNIKLIVHEHGEINGNKFWYNTILKMFLNKINLFVAVSDATKRGLIQNTKVEEKKIEILYNFVDLSKFSQDKLKGFDKSIERKKLELNLEDYVLGFAGRLDKLKGCDVLIRSITNIKNPNTKVVIAGDGIERKELEKLAENLNVKDKIIFLGYVKDMIKFYSLIDCHVIPSRSESFGLTAIEAQAFAIPVIASSINGLNEIVLDKKTGLLFEPENEKDLAEKIELIYTDENLRNELTKNGLENAKKYSLKNYLTNLEGIYYGLL